MQSRPADLDAPDACSSSTSCSCGAADMAARARRSAGMPGDRSWCSPVPPACGKSDWAIALAEQVPGRDRQRRLRAGVPRPGHRHGQAGAPRCARAFPHHLIDICDPAESYSAGRFVTDALASIAGDPRARPHAAAGRRHHAVSARAAVQGLAPLPQASPALRAQLDEQARAPGLAGAARGARAARPAGGGPHPVPATPAHPARAGGVPHHRAADLASCSAPRSARSADWPLMRWVLAPGDRAQLHAAARRALRSHDGRRASSMRCGLRDAR